MNHKEKLGYIGLGAVIMLIGMSVGSILTPQLVVQHNGVFDTITYREIKVVDKTGEAKIYLTVFEEGAGISIRDKDGGSC